MKRFVTEYIGKDGENYTGHVDALDFQHAQRLCDDRGRGEEVKGVLMAVIDGNVSADRVDAMTRALAEQGDDEPPEAEEFDRA
jgi:hypothetical protein